MVVLYVNGNQCYLSYSSISYEDLCEIADIPLRKCPTIAYAYTEKDTHRTVCGTVLSGQEGPVYHGITYTLVCDEENT